MLTLLQSHYIPCLVNLTLTHISLNYNLQIKQNYSFIKEDTLSCVQLKTHSHLISKRVYKIFFKNLWAMFFLLIRRSDSHSSLISYKRIQKYLVNSYIEKGTIAHNYYILICTTGHHMVVSGVYNCLLFLPILHSLWPQKKHLSWL